MKDWEDPIVHEVWEARAKIMEEAGSLDNWFKMLKKEQQEKEAHVLQGKNAKVENKN